MRLIDLTGQRFTRLTVIERAPNNGKQPAWLCRCDCGGTKVVQGGNLRGGSVQSCGCLRRTSDGQAAQMTGAYSSWKAMIQRCTNPNHPRWREWGGRGITVCARWRSFPNFLADMDERPAGMSIDRIDNDCGYEPGNCRWATRSEQQYNRRRRKAAA